MKVELIFLRVYHSSDCFVSTMRNFSMSGERFNEKSFHLYAKFSFRRDMMKKVKWNKKENMSSRIIYILYFIFFASRLNASIKSSNEVKLGVKKKWKLLWWWFHLAWWHEIISSNNCEENEGNIHSHTIHSPSKKLHTNLKAINFISSKKIEFFIPHYSWTKCGGGWMKSCNWKLIKLMAARDGMQHIEIL